MKSPEAGEVVQRLGPDRNRQKPPIHFERVARLPIASVAQAFRPAKHIGRPALTDGQVICFG